MPPRRHGTRQHKLFDAVDRLIEYLGPRIGATKEEMEAFFHDLQKEAFARGPQEILKEVPHAPSACGPQRRPSMTVSCVASSTRRSAVMTPPSCPPWL